VRNQALDKEFPSGNPVYLPGDIAALRTCEEHVNGSKLCRLTRASERNVPSELCIFFLIE